MPAPNNEKSIEQMYWDHVRAMSPAERVRSASRLNANVWAMLETQVRNQHPEINATALKFAVAKRFYWNEPKVLQMLSDAEQKENADE